MKESLISYNICLIINVVAIRGVGIKVNENLDIGSRESLVLLLMINTVGIIVDL